MILILGFVSLMLWGQVKKYQDEAFKWRKRWIIERFGAGVEGEGDYFVTTQYTTDVPCLVFARKKKDLEFHGSRIRHWDHHIGKNYLSEYCDMPDEAGVGLPENPARDTRPWVSSGIGLCALPPSLHEKGLAAQGKSAPFKARDERV